MLRRTSLLLAGMLCLAVLPVLGQEDPSSPTPKVPDQVVMVTRVDAELKTGTKVVGKAALAEILVGSKVNGDWLWIPGAKGWIQRSNVVPIDRAAEHFTAQINRSPTSRNYFERGAAHVSLEQYDKAIADFSRAIQLDPGNLPAVNDRGTTYRRIGHQAKAKVDFDTVIARGVRHPAAYTNRGQIWLDLGNVEQAMVDLHVALELDQRFAPAWEASGSAREAMGHIPKALDNYRVAVEIDPSFALAWNNRAWLLATTADGSLRNGRQAVEYATKACELTGYAKADVLDTLAAAYAENGQFDQAVRRSKEALEKADE
ncbi:MAG: tetratricopeptide repeat protein, partial [Planctomycetota bacterium]|nr:tetratricopeptide repeat protein [Planctomycetota bacterium]